MNWAQSHTQNDWNDLWMLCVCVCVRVHHAHCTTHIVREWVRVCLCNATASSHLLTHIFIIYCVWFIWNVEFATARHFIPPPHDETEKYERYIPSVDCRTYLNAQYSHMLSRLHGVCAVCAPCTLYIHQSRGVRMEIIHSIVAWTAITTAIYSLTSPRTFCSM